MLAYMAGRLTGFAPPTSDEGVGVERLRGAV